MIWFVYYTAAGQYKSATWRKLLNSCCFFDRCKSNKIYSLKKNSYKNTVKENVRITQVIFAFFLYHYPIEQQDTSAFIHIHAG